MTVSGKRSRIQVDLPVPRGPNSRIERVGVGSNLVYIDAYFTGNMHIVYAYLGLVHRDRFGVKKISVNVGSQRPGRREVVSVWRC